MGEATLIPFILTDFLDSLSYGGDIESVAIVGDN